MINIHKLYVLSKDMINDDRVILLKQNILWQAKCFLDNADEFYPFGTAVDHVGKMHTVAMHADSEFPNAGELSFELDQQIKKAIVQKRYTTAAMGVNVDIVKELKQGEAIRQSAIRVSFYVGESVFDKYFLYKKGENGYFFESYDFDEGSTSWELPDSDNADFTAFTLKQIVDGTKPVLYVVHDREGNWQFLANDKVSINDLMIIRLKELIKSDPSLKDILWLPEGTEAIRERLGDDWSARIFS